ncbi:MAG: TonB-dependent receptor, partial [Acidobacteria bacterium]|nr:TonB-dependent receptor [Acidobacteriota bacterium]
MSERIGFSMLLIALLALLFGHFIPAQVTTATILGTTRDESGGFIPGVSVTVRNLGTGIERTVITDDQGRYRVPALSLGNYEVEASLEGFQTAVRSGITLTVGREAVVNLTLRLGEITERVTVTGEAPLVQTTSASLEDLVATQQIEDLPLNGRSYTQLALLQPGVVTVGSTNFGGVSGGGAKLSVGGTRSTTTYFYLDGTDVKGGLGHTPGSAAGQTLGVETIREFSLLANNYSAEYGGSGGVINTVTKSGTNEFHGSVFEFHRNSALDARNFFDRDPRSPAQRSDPPPFKRNQFGFTVGGPLVSDRTFFFGSFEALRDRLSNTSIINVPTAALKQGNLPSGPVQIHPLIQRYLDVMPLPNGEIFNDGSGEFISARSQPTNEEYFMVRLDHRFSDADSIFGRYVFDDAERVQPLSYPQFFRTALTRSQYLTIEETKIISAEWLNTLQFGFNRSFGADTNQVEGLDASFNLIPLPERVPPDLQMPTLENWGSASSGDRFVVLNSFQVRDKLSYTSGRHSLRTGFELYRNHYNGFTRSRIHGRARFDTLRDFLEGRILSWEFMAPGTGNMRGFRYWDFGLYLQDDIQLTPNFSLNLGLRWEFVTVPTEVAGRVSNLRDPLNDVRSTVGDPMFLLPKNNFGPRFGFAWDPFSDGKTSIRGGSGLFHSQMTHTYWRLPALQNDPFFLRVQVNNPPTFPPSVEVGDLPPLQAGPIQFDLKTPYVIHYNLTVQRELLPQTVLAVSYVGSQSRHLGRFANWNIRRFEILPDGRKFFPAGAPRFNPAFASTDTRQFDANGHYDSLQVRLSKRFSEGLQVQSSYT